MVTTWKEKTIRGCIHALVGGEGTPVVLLAGWPETAQAYTEVFPHLAPHHQVFALDLPELGESAPSANGYDVFTISTILQGFFEGEADEPYHLVSHDVGAWIAFAWAAQFPAEVKSLTLLDAALPGLAPPLSFSLRPKLNTRLWQFSFNTLPELPEILTQGRGRELFDWLFDHKAVHPEKIRRARRDHYVESYSRPGKMSNGFWYYRAAGLSALMNIDDFAKRELKMPVLALGRKGGAAWSVFNSVEAHAADVRDDVIEDCGHYMEEKLEEVARRLLEFFDYTKSVKGAENSDTK